MREKKKMLLPQISSTEKFLMTYLNQEQHEEKKGQSEEKPVTAEEEVMEVTNSNQPPEVIRISEGHN
jgi:hypothetical protein